MTDRQYRAYGDVLPIKSLESYDYDRTENKLYEWRFHNPPPVAQKELDREAKRKSTLQWVFAFIIGVLTALVAFFIDFVVHHLMDLKFNTVSDSILHCVGDGCMALSLLYFVLFNVGFVTVAALLTVMAPVAAGSGIPEIKCHLNGIKIPGAVRIKTLVAKVIGVLFSVAGGLMVGKEGPMIHSGAIIAAGLTHGESSSIQWIKTDFITFRHDRAKRDFVSCGAAAGVAAAFGAPIGGVLFSLEEGASFWNQALTWRTFFCTMVCAFTLNIFLSGSEGDWGALSGPGLIDFGNFSGKGTLWNIGDLLVFAIMGVLGGLFGAAFNYLNQLLTVYRMKHVRSKGRKFVEALLVAMVTSIALFLITSEAGQCADSRNTRQDNENVHLTPRSFFCRSNQYNDMATLAFNPQEAAIKELFHQTGPFTLQTLAIYFCTYFVIACWTYGVAVPSGLFVPCLLCGAAFGRFMGLVVETVIPRDDTTLHGTYALIGAASFLGGVVRMTISLTVILIEATNEISYGLPLMLTLMIAKLVGDNFNESLYDIHIELRHRPLLGWAPPELLRRFTAHDVMTKAPVCLSPCNTVRQVLDVLYSCAHNGFPVVKSTEHHEGCHCSCGKDDNPTMTPGQGLFVGLVSRAQLLTILHYRAFGPMQSDGAISARLLFHEDFVRSAGRVRLRKLSFTDEELDLYVNISTYMKRGPYTMWEHAALPRVFSLFRAMGLRHLPVLNVQNEVVGIITRADLTHLENHGGNSDHEE